MMASPFLLSGINRELPTLHIRVALAAVHRTVVFGLKGHLGGCAALSADCIVHHAGTATLGFLSDAALTATRRLILETFFGIEFLLTGGEHKFLTAVTANQRLVLIHGKLDPLK